MDSFGWFFFDENTAKGLVSSQVALTMFIRAALKYGFVNNARELRRKLFEPTPLWGPSRTASKTVKDAWETSKTRECSLQITIDFAVSKNNFANGVATNASGNVHYNSKQQEVQIDAGRL